MSEENLSAMKTMSEGIHFSKKLRPTRQDIASYVSIRTESNAQFLCHHRVLPVSFYTCQQKQVRYRVVANQLLMNDSTDFIKNKNVCHKT